MTATNIANGKPRKQLSHEIDRLEQLLGDQCTRIDGIVDALAEGLPEAVAQACREGARMAIKDALIEVISNPELRQLIALAQPAPGATASPAAPPAAPAPQPKKPGLWDRVRAKVAAAREAAAGAVQQAKEALTRRCAVAGDAVAALGRLSGESFPLRKTLLVGLGVGALAAAACLLMPQAASAVAGGVGAACTTVSLQVGNWLARAARRFGLLS